MYNHFRWPWLIKIIFFSTWFQLTTLAVYWILQILKWMQIVALKNREPNESINLNRETEGCSSNRSENSSDIVRLDISRTTTIDSPLSSAHPTSSRPLFPPSMRPTSSTGVAQLFQNSSSRLDLPCQKNITDQTVKEESSFCNMFCGIDDQNGFWPWLEQQQYNWLQKQERWFSSRNYEE